MNKRFRLLLIIIMVLVMGINQAICSVIFGSFAVAEIELKSLSTEELIALKAAIQQELQDRGEIKSATVPAGEYVVGEDIPAGSYSVTTNQTIAMLPGWGLQACFYCRGKSN